MSTIQVHMYVHHFKSINKSNLIIYNQRPRVLILQVRITRRMNHIQEYVGFRIMIRTISISTAPGREGGRKEEEKNEYTQTQKLAKINLMVFGLHI